jgi:hypothetical protein
MSKNGYLIICNDEPHKIIMKRFLAEVIGRRVLGSSLFSDTRTGSRYKSGQLNFPASFLSEPQVQFGMIFLEMRTKG